MTEASNETRYYAELFSHDEQGKGVIKSWVFEDGIWRYRELTTEEIGKVLRMSKVVK